MMQLFTLKMNDWSSQKILRGNKICTLRDEPKCDIGDLFTVDYDGSKSYFKIIDIWEVPKDFAIKFLWRLEGAESPSEISDIITNIYPNATVLYAHIFKEIIAPEDVILKLVGNND